MYRTNKEEKTRPIVNISKTMIATRISITGLLAAALLIVVACFMVEIYMNSKLYSIKQHRIVAGLDISVEVEQVIEGLVEMRNNLSRELNLKQQKLGKIECQDQAKATIMDTGGWCARFSVEGGGQHITDVDLIPTLAALFKDKSVASFGDGPGRYKQLLLETGLLKGYDAYDGAPFSEETSEGLVTFLDLTLPQYGLPMYDWVVSLEVAQHIQNTYEHTFVDNVVRHSKEGVVLSWSLPGVRGFYSRNGRTVEYVQTLMSSFGFDHDSVSSLRLQNASTLPWFKKALNVYKRKEEKGDLDDLNA